MRRYEILFIAQSDLSDDNMNELIDRYKTIITKSQGSIVKVEKWGTRKLAYEIKKQKKGIYVLIDFAGKSAIVTELERMFRIEDRILKYLTVMKDSEVNLLDLEKEKQPEIPVETNNTLAEPDKPIVSPKTENAPEADDEFTAEVKGEQNKP